ncbi:hypothetical protein COOONC_04584 [Cooperia oncophora]
MCTGQTVLVCVELSRTMLKLAFLMKITLTSMQIRVFSLAYTFLYAKGNRRSFSMSLNDMMRMGKQFSPLESGPSIMCDGGSSCRTSAVLNVAP